MRTQVHQERVLAGQRVDPASVRDLVQDSWLRSRGYGVDPEAAPPVDLVDEALEDHRTGHPMSAVLPVVRRLLVEHAASEDLVVAVTDAAGLLLWVEGHNGLRARCERVHFVAGALWDERSAGTNAPGVALALDRPVRIHAAEHWARQVHPWSCSAAPVHHPRTGALLGALDVTGDRRAGTAGTLALVAATVAVVERELLLADLGARVPQRHGDLQAHVDLQGNGDLQGHGELQVLGAPAYSGVPLSTRHAEILLLLAEHPGGLTADQLGCALDERDLDPVTVRAEVHRLRRELPTGMLLGRPYRLASPVPTDLDRVRRLLAQGRLDLAVGAYRSPVLPRSGAPGVVAIRNGLAQQIRVALLRAADAGPLQAWADDAGRDDLEVWEACLALQPPGPGRDRAEAHVRELRQYLR